jgi:2-dehydro-3-deoxygluconokinase
VVDPVGVGDAFMGGFLHAISLFPDDHQRQLDYSLAAASLKNTIPGDFNLSTEEEILDVLAHRYNAQTLYKTIE